MRLIKNILFILLFSLLFFEFFQNHTACFSFDKLKGEHVLEPKPDLTLDNWLGGSYQEHQMKYFEQSMDIRPFLVRLHNQVDYSIFNKINTNTIEVGKDQYLYETTYIESYLGHNFIGENKIITKANMLAYVQQELKKRGVDLIFIVAPGKPAFFPEYLPSKYDLTKRKRTNYDAFSEQLEKQKINHIDFAKYLLKLKPISPYPLFTRCGVHWSGYAATLTADSLLEYMEKLRNIDMIDFYAAGGTETTTPRYFDADLGGLLNLMVDIPSYKMYYPNIVFKKDSTKVKPNVLIIGDSFSWSWISFYDYFPQMFDEKSALWYYNHDVGWGFGASENALTANLNLKKETLGRDFILIVNTESNLANPGQFFIDKMFEMLHADTLTTTK